jgi:hypothetical protein
LLSKEVHSLEHRASANARGVEPTAKNGVLLLECSHPLANTRRLWLVGSAVDLVQSLLRGKRTVPVTRELLAEGMHQALELAERVQVRSCGL